ncbi:stage II sporulation protein E [Streptomyces sp. SLBN-118]|nr:stage II sporulation protein E [Streptomyces sp. SLBN-118]
MCVEAADRIGTALDEKITCLEVVSLLGSGLADAAAVDLLPQELQPGGGPGVERAAVTGHAELLPPYPSGAVLRGRTTLDEGRLAVPLSVHDHVLGAVLIARASGSFTDRDLLIARSVARRAAVAVEHARLFGQAQRTAVELQRALLTDPGLPCTSGAPLLVMGDVMGHGVEAAVDMNSYRSALRDVPAADLPPHRVVRRLDMHISDASARRPATCLLVRMDPALMLASFSSAGHLPPVVFSRDGVAHMVNRSCPSARRCGRSRRCRTGRPSPTGPIRRASGQRAERGLRADARRSLTR